MTDWITNANIKQHFTVKTQNGCAMCGQGLDKQWTRGID